MKGQGDDINIKIHKSSRSIEERDSGKERGDKKTAGSGDLLRWRNREERDRGKSKRNKNGMSGEGRRDSTWRETREGWVRTIFFLWMHIVHRKALTKPKTK